MIITKIYYLRCGLLDHQELMGHRLGGKGLCQGQKERQKRISHKIISIGYRGVKMCGVGNEIVHVKCGKQGGTTSATSATTATTASASTTSAATPAPTTPGGDDPVGPDYYDEYYG